MRPSSAKPEVGGCRLGPRKCALLRNGPGKAAGFDSVTKPREAGKVPTEVTSTNSTALELSKIARALPKAAPQRGLALAPGRKARRRFSICFLFSAVSFRLLVAQSVVCPLLRDLQAKAHALKLLQRGFKRRQTFTA